jgi:hypothetical protein
MRFVTLGPATNHDMVGRLYLEKHGIPQDSLAFVDDPYAGVAQVMAMEADYLILCSVHPDAAPITGRYFRELFIVDTFISASKTLAVLRRKGASRGRLGVFEPTASYVDPSAWSDVAIERKGSLVTLSQRLLAGAYDAALVYLEIADQNPGLFEIEDVIGSPDDVWIVFGRERATSDGPGIHRDSAVARAWRAERAANTDHAHS